MTIRAPALPINQAGTAMLARRGSAAAVTIWQVFSHLKRRWLNWLFLSYQPIWSSTRSQAGEAAATGACRRAVPSAGDSKPLSGVSDSGTAVKNIWVLLQVPRKLPEFASVQFDQ